MPLSSTSMWGARSRSLAATRSTHRWGGSRMWSSTEMSQSRLRSSVMRSSASCVGVVRRRVVRSVSVRSSGVASGRQLADGDVLDLLEVADALGAAFAAEAALLVAAPGGVGAEHARVHGDGAGAQPTGDGRTGRRVLAVHLA